MALAAAHGNDFSPKYQRQMESRAMNELACRLFLPCGHEPSLRQSLWWASHLSIAQLRPPTLRGHGGVLVLPPLSPRPLTSPVQPGERNSRLLRVVEQRPNARHCDSGLQTTHAT